MAAKSFKRLPESVAPKNYCLSILADLEKFSFSGNETILLEIKEEVISISLNSVNLKLDDVKLVQGEKEHVLSKIEEDKESEVVTFNFKEKIKVGVAKLSLKFGGVLEDSMKGFYRSKYTDHENTLHYLASTQFEPTDARRAFPCWDEPAIKATFNVTLMAKDGYTVLSNMNEIKTDNLGDGYVSHTFAETPIMSTYLVAFAIGDFEKITRKIEYGIDISVYTPVGKLKLATYALEVACKTLPFYVTYFNVPYPLPKLDLIAIPDFSAGAMENWGLITYRETALLIDEEQSSARSKLYVALVVGHEIAHQWFGNLVTMEWWTHLWLNEGFATWVEYLSVDHCFPEYRVWKSFATADFATAMKLDGLKNSHPVEVQVNAPSEIDEIFDSISYSKGACIIRMIYEYIGKDAFTKGLSEYLRAFSYSNAKTESLWQHLSSSSNQPIKDIMGTWTSQMGYPVVTVSYKNVSNGIEVSLSQKRFTSCGTASNDNSHWIIPITITTSNNPNAPTVRLLLDTTSKVINISLNSTPEWIKLNHGQVGFYRVRYHEDILNNLFPHISKFSPEERLGFLNDGFALARAGSTPTTDFLNLVSSFKDEQDDTVWEEIASSLSTLMSLMYYSKNPTQNVQNAKKFAIQMLSRVLEYVGMDKSTSKAPSETHHILLLRGTVMHMLVKAEHPQVVSTLSNWFDEYLSGNLMVDSNIRVAMFRAGISSGGSKALDVLLNYYLQSTETEEKIRVLSSLGEVTDPTLIRKVLDFSIGKNVRYQDTHTVILSCAANPLARDIVWEFLKENWCKLLDRYQGGFVICRILKESISGFACMQVHDDIKQFFEKNPCNPVKRSLHQALESIEISSSWLKRDEVIISNWLAKNI